ncbi:flavodoxin [Faecalimonas umbilicata]|uniref:flavodoxin n=1 Tax=Faecalimonas umbilicata TaxID=1912855 RepID=UPI002A7EEB12|nr:flavodoxin [Faecalimonas umbilicata]MDY4596323.1 flavodoxin [Faecalimonas umbilicata]
MDKIYVVYWSQTGNTEAMAEAVARGIRSEGKESAVVEVGSISPEELKEEAVFALGCPAMGAEVLEESEMEPFVETLETFVKGKTVGLFGSYGWGDGEWMRDWEARMQQAGANVIGGEGVICQETPDQETLEKCEELGKNLAAL